MGGRTLTAALLLAYVRLSYVESNCSSLADFCVCIGDGIAQCVDTNFVDLSFLRSLRNRSKFNEIIVYHNNIPTIHNQIFHSLQFSNLKTIRLAYSGITTIEPRAFQGLRKLKKLILVRNNIKSLHPDTFLNSTKLTLLDLSDNQLSEINAIRNVPSLEDCRLPNNSITTLPNETFTSSQTSRLKSIVLANNELTNIGVQAFHGLENLETLTLSENRIESLHPDTFQNTTNLRELNLRNNKITQIDFVRNVPSLKYLLLRKNKITVIRNHTFICTHMSSLLHIDLAENEITSIESAAFQGLHNLWDLILSGNNITYIHPETFQNTTNLRYLDLKHNRIFELNFVRDIMMLWNLDLSYNEVTTVQTETFFHPNLTQLTNNAPKTTTVKFILARTITNINLSNNKITTIEQGALEGLFKLYHLDLSGNNISFLYPNIFQNNTQLNTLYVNNNKLSDLNSIYNAISLEICDTSYNIISVSPNTALNSGISNLRNINLTSNDIAYLHPDTFLNYTSLVLLNLTNNQISQLSFVPNILTLEHLFLSKNSISYLSNRTFSKSHASKLKSIDISYNSITTIERGTFEGLQNLLVLNMSANNISFLEPSIFQHTTGLKELNLQFNYISILDFICNVPHLKYLHLSNNHISILKKGLFSNSDHIKLIHLSNNTISAVEEGIFQNLWHLQHLDLSFNNITFLPENSFVNTTKVTTLNLSRNNLANANFLRNMSSLITCDLSMNQISHLPNEMFANSLTSRINSINISHNIITTIGYMAFHNLLRLQELDLTENAITSLNPDTFQYCASMLKLDLSNNRISHTAEIRNAPRLKHLYLFNNTIHRLTNNSFLPTRLTQVVYINLSKNGMVSIEVGSFHSLRLLKYLDLSRNNLTFLHRDLFRSNTLLSALDISDNRIANIDGNLRIAPNLEFYDASNNIISCIANNIFSNQLRYIDLSNNDISTLEPQAFHGLHKLQILDISMNNITIIPSNILRDIQNIPTVNMRANPIVTALSTADSNSQEKVAFNLYDISNIELNKFAKLYMWIFQMNMVIN